MRVLALNCGSSSVRAAVVETADGKRVCERHEELDGRGHAEILEAWTRDWQGNASSELEGVAAVGHRVVHGGASFSAATRIDATTLTQIESLSHWAPLHNPANLEGIRALTRAFPQWPQVAVFDTAFHQTLPPRAYLYALPHSLYREHGIRRFGFHGSSHRAASKHALELLEIEAAGSRLIVAHLGNGCSAAAILGGESVDTTMGLSPLEGLVMGTRSGDVDPALHERLAQIRGLDPAGVTALLNEESGLLGLSELSGDMRTLERAAASGHAGALRAIEVFCYRLAKSLGSLMVPLGGLDALVFTGGIGENSAEIRRRCVSMLAPFGLSLDADRNARHGASSHGCVQDETSTPILVIPADEEAAIAEETARALA